MIGIPTSFGSFDDFTLSIFERVASLLAITLKPVITIFDGLALALIAVTTFRVKGAIVDMEEPVGTEKALPADNVGELPEKTPDGNVIVIVSVVAAKAFVTFKDSVSVPPDTLVHAAVPLNPGRLGVTFFQTSIP